MARGWESKSVEAQQDEASRRRSTSSRPGGIDPEREARRATLTLARARTAADLAAATRPAHRRMLEAALAALDAQLRVVDGPPAPGETAQDARPR